MQSRVLTSGRRRTAGFGHGGWARGLRMWVPLETGEGRNPPGPHSNIVPRDPAGLLASRLQDNQSVFLSPPNLW